MEFILPYATKKLAIGVKVTWNLIRPTFLTIQKILNLIFSL